jgi:hypothetical protein
MTMQHSACNPGGLTSQTVAEGNKHTCNSSSSSSHALHHLNVITPLITAVNDGHIASNAINANPDYH